MSFKTLGIKLLAFFVSVYIQAYSDSAILLLLFHRLLFLVVERGPQEDFGRSQFRSVSHNYGIPRATLYDKIHGKSAVDSSYWTEQKPKEENSLVSWIKGMAERGFGTDR